MGVQMVHEPKVTWRPEELSKDALGISASRRTDIPALMSVWFADRLEAGFAEYIPAGPPRRIRRSLAPADVTHFTFWTKWPRPFFGVLDGVLRTGYPVLWNVTITGLGGTALEPNVPVTDKAVAATLDLAARLPAGAVVWRYDPVFVSERYDEAHHVRTFSQLCDRLRGHVDRVAMSFVQRYGRRVTPDLRRYQDDSNDPTPELTLEAQVELLGRFREIADAAELPLTLCCQPVLAARLGWPPTRCNGWSWAVRVYPELGRRPPLRDRPTRDGCACSREIDIGVYDTCTFGCRYCYASRDLSLARRRFATHDPQGACLLP